MPLPIDVPAGVLDGLPLPTNSSSARGGSRYSPLTVADLEIKRKSDCR